MEEIIFLISYFTGKSASYLLFWTDKNFVREPHN